MKYLFKVVDKLRAIYYRKYYSYKGVHITKNSKLDIGTSFINGSLVKIGQYCYIGPFGYLNGVGEIEIKRGSIIGPYVKVFSGSHNFRSSISIPYDTVILKGKVVIEENVWIGANVTILPGVIIGEGAIVGANTLVSKDIDPFSIVVGNPVRKIGERDKEEYYRLKGLDLIYLKKKYEGF